MDSVKFGRSLKQLIWIAVIFNWAVLGLYFYKFAPGFWFNLSESHEVWAQFGDFYGGLLGPYLGFLAFLGVLITVALQKNQLDLVKAQAKHEELQRVASSIAMRLVDRLSESPVRLQQLQGRLNGMSGDLRNFIFVVSAAKAANAHLDDEVFNYALETGGFLALNLESLAWCLNRYRREGGSDAVLDYYRYEFASLAVQLSVLQPMVDACPETAACFSPNTG